MRVYRVALSVLILLAACGSFAQKVHVGFNKGVDFSKFKTYAWLESKHPADGRWADRVVTAIDRQLANKGLQRVDKSASPDLEVVYNFGIKERTIVLDYNYGYTHTEYPYGPVNGPFWVWPGGQGSWSREVENEANLVVDLIDASRKDMVWRGVAKGTLSNTKKENEQKLNKAVKKMFKKYPP